MPGKKSKRNKASALTAGDFGPGRKLRPSRHPYTIERNPWKRNTVKLDIAEPDVATYYGVANLANALEGNGEVAAANKKSLVFRLEKMELWAMAETQTIPTVNLDVYSLGPSTFDLAQPPPSVGTTFYGLVSRQVDFGSSVDPARAGWVYSKSQQSQVIPVASQQYFAGVAVPAGSSGHFYVTFKWCLSGTAPPQLTAITSRPSVKSEEPPLEQISPTESLASSFADLRV